MFFSVCDIFVHVYICCVLCTGQCHALEDSDEMTFLHPRILTPIYQVKLILMNSDIEFRNKSGCGPWGKQRILTPNYGTLWGLWHIIFTVSESPGGTHPLLPGRHIDWCFMLSFRYDSNSWLCCWSDGELGFDHIPRDSIVVWPWSVINIQQTESGCCCLSWTSTPGL